MKKIIIVLLLLVIFSGGFFIWWNNGESPVNTNDATQKIFVVRENENLRDVGYDLKKENLIRDPIVFFLLIKQQGLDGKIQAGDFELSSAMSTKEIAHLLTHGVTLGIRVTIPEGKRATEIAEILQQKIPTYQPSWKDSLATEEGYLFPDTYFIPRNADINTIMGLMTSNFDKKYQQASADATTKLSKNQVVILASIIQREANTPDDMKLVASVLTNRLSIGMALGSDVTVEYALGYQPLEKTWWKKDLNADDLTTNSLYNTRLNSGLPPTPICNPGVDALKAALNPPNTDYMYYVSDDNGKLHFAKTIEQHNANVAKYLPKYLQ